MASSSSSHQKSNLAADILSAGALLGKTILLLKFIQLPFNEVRHAVVTANKIYEIIHSLEGDTTTLRVTIDAYVRSVEAFLASNKDTSVCDVSEVEISPTFESVFVANKRQEKQLLAVAQKIAVLEASLQILREGEAGLKKLNDRKLELTSVPKLKFSSSSLEQKLKDLKDQQREMIVVLSCAREA